MLILHLGEVRFLRHRIPGHPILCDRSCSSIQLNGVDHSSHSGQRLEIPNRLPESSSSLISFASQSKHPATPDPDYL